MAVAETRAQLVARLRAQHRQSVDAMYDWGLSDEEIAEQYQDDEDWFAGRRLLLEAESSDRATREQEADGRIHDRMRRRDDAIVPAHRFYRGID
jgi:hypothetical protein